MSPRSCSTMRDPRDSSRNGHRTEKLPHIAHRFTTASSLRAAAPPRPVTTFVGKPRLSKSKGSSRGSASERSDTTPTSPGLGDAPLCNYTGPTPKSLGGVRAAFFETKGMSLESIRE